MRGGVLIYVCIQFEVESMLRWKLDDEESILKTQSTVEELIGFVKELHSITNNLKLGNPGLVFQVRATSPTHTWSQLTHTWSQLTHTYFVSRRAHILGLYLLLTRTYS
jgi:hypothetical protein